jgi:hypothetical protein
VFLVTEKDKAPKLVMVFTFAAEMFLEFVEIPVELTLMFLELVDTPVLLTLTPAEVVLMLAEWVLIFAMLAAMAVVTDVS